MGKGDKNLEVFVDDLIIWYKRLKMADIKFIYERRKSIFELCESLAVCGIIPF